MEIKELTLLQKLNFTSQLCFAYLTCERLYPNYVYFSENFDFGNSIVLRKAIDYIFQNIFELTPDLDKIKIYVNEVEKNTPDTEDFSTHFVSSALDACTAVTDSLNFIIDKDFSIINYISNYAIDTISMHIQEIENLDFNNDKNFFNKISNHPLMQKEIAIQSGIISFLFKSEQLDIGDIQILLNLQKS